jgi:DNA-binding transcriptional regulator YdaS (Cro superfamily)
MKLVDYLEKYSVNKKAFAKRIGISHVSFYRIVSGKQQATLKTALMIEQLTNGEVTCRDLLTED